MAADNRGPELAATVISFLVVSVVTVALRCYVRAGILKAFQVEDWLAVATMISFATYCAVVLLSISHGAGKHLHAVPVESIPKVLKMRWLGEIIYVVTSLLVKCTVGAFLLRICSHAWQKSVICAVLVVCIVYHVFFVFMTAFQCWPVAYFWHRYTGGLEGKCWDKEIIMVCTYVAAALNAITDWVLGLLPIALVSNLDLSSRSKALVSFILGLGSVASTATIVRIPYIRELAQSGDFMHDFTDLSIWSTVENGLGLIASSVATLRPLVRVVMGGTRAERSSRRQPPGYSWRESATAITHRGTRSDNPGYYRMDDCVNRHPNPKVPEQAGGTNGNGPDVW